MSNDITNKTLATLLVVAIAVSVIGTFLVVSKPSGITGAAQTTGTGNVNLSITGIIAIAVSGNINFGAGSVTAGQASATLDSSVVNATNGDWAFAAQYITIENQGNKNVVLVANSGSTAADFIGGTSPAQEIEGVAHGGGGCAAPAAYGAYSTAGDKSICPVLAFAGTVDKVNAAVKLTIPSDAAVGAKGQIITFTAS